MVEGDVLKEGEAARVQSGKYAGLVGEAVSFTESGAWVLCQGNFDGEPIDRSIWFNFDNLGRNNGEA